MELKPCPFCGGEAEFVSDKLPDTKILGEEVICTNIRCGVQPHTKPCINKKTAIKAWNTRAGDER